MSANLYRRMALLTLALALLGGAAQAAAAPGDDEARIAAARPRPRDPVALAEALGGTGPLPRTSRTEPLPAKVGDVERFWVSEPATGEHRQVEARLRYAGPQVLMYVDTMVEADQALVERSARQFEEQIYPRDRALFGHELAPGIDGDGRLTILNTLVRGAGGYFSPSDQVVRQANRFSNERDMFVINVASFPIGSNSYLATLAHEFQHMIHEASAPGSAAWFDEGLASLAEDLNGYGDALMPRLYLRAPDLALTDWDASGPHYGQARLLMRYVHEQYAGDAGLAALIQSDAGNDLEAFARLAAQRRPDVRRFADLFADWAVATLLHDPSAGDGRYFYQDRPEAPAVDPAQPGRQRASVGQFGIDYLAIEGPATLSFDGAEQVALAGARPAEGRYAWWSNRGDQRASTLTRALDLRKAKRATLRFQAWYELERGYDYAFVSVSVDAGATWQTLPSNDTTTEDPQGMNFGQGWTGVSGIPGGDLGGERGRWVAQQVDLSAYAGKSVLLRFWAITDPAYNGAGLLIDDLRVPEIGLSDGFERGETGWIAEGFVRVSGALPQQWAVRLVRFGQQPVVEPVKLDAAGRGRVQLKAGERAVLVVIGTTRFTSERAAYEYVLTRTAR